MTDIQKYTDIQEYFGCTCYDLKHVLLFIYISSSDNNEDDEDDNIYVSAFLSQFRTQIIPEFWSHYFWTDDFYKKDYWEDFYWTSIWRRIVIGLKYIINNSKEEYGIFDCIAIRRIDKERLLNVLSIFDKKNVQTDKINCKIENRNYYLEFVSNPNELELEDKISLGELIYTQIQFKNFRFLKRLWLGIKYIVNSHPGDVSFEMDALNTTKLKNLIITEEKRENINIPNETTIKTFKKTGIGKELHEVLNTNELRKKLEN